MAFIFFDVLVNLMESINTRCPIQLTSHDNILLILSQVLFQRLIDHLLKSFRIYFLDVGVLKHFSLLWILFKTLTHYILVGHSWMKFSLEEIKHKIGNDIWICYNQIGRLAAVRIDCWKVICFGHFTA